MPLKEMSGGHEVVTEICPECGGEARIFKGGQKAGMWSAVHVVVLDAEKRIYRKDGYCSSLCMAKAMGIQDVSEGLEYKALKDMGIDPFTMMAPDILDWPGINIKELEMIRYLLFMKLQADGKIIDRDAGKIELPWVTKPDDPKGIGYHAYAARRVELLLTGAWGSGQIGGLFTAPETRYTFAKALASATGKGSPVPIDRSSLPPCYVLPKRNFYVGGILSDGEEELAKIDQLRLRGINIDHAAFWAINSCQSGLEKFLKRGIMPVGVLNIKGFTEPRTRMDGSTTKSLFIV